MNQPYTQKPNPRIILENVRLSYSDLYEAKPYLDNDPTFKASFIIVPGSEQDKLIARVTQELIQENFKGRGQCPTNYFSGDTKGYAGWIGNLILQSSSPLNQPPQLRKRNGQISIPSDNLFYAGCYVNAVVDAYYHTTFHKVCGGLKAVQFRNDGDALVGTPVDEDVFKNYDEVDPVAADTNWMQEQKIPSSLDSMW